MPTLFVLNNVPVFFFHKRGNKASNTFLKVHPPLPPPSNRVKHTRAVFWRGGGGGDFRAILCIFFCLLEKKTGTFFKIKSRHAKFQWIPSSLKNRCEIGTYAFLRGSPSIDIVFIPSTMPTSYFLPESGSTAVISKEIKHQERGIGLEAIERSLIKISSK